MKFELIAAVPIGSHYASYLEYGDEGDLNRSELKLFNDWMRYYEELGATLFDQDTDDRNEFGICDVTNLRSNVHTVRIYK